MYSCSSLVERSEPSLALSTFLLHHLPVSKDDLDQKTAAEDKPSSKPAIAYLSLPLGNGSCCTLHAALVRNSLNTITAVLQTDTVIVNECPWGVELVELVEGESEEREATWKGKILVGERREKVTMLGPTDTAVCVHKRVSFIGSGAVFTNLGRGGVLPGYRFQPPHSKLLLLHYNFVHGVKLN